LPPAFVFQGYKCTKLDFGWALLQNMLGSSERTPDSLAGT